MSPQPKTRCSPEEYLAIERKARYKSEYFNGEIFAMTGASRRQNLITVNVSSSFHTQLKQNHCEVYAADMRVKVSATGSYTYPDVVVVCGEPLFDDEHADTLLNPTVIVEALSESTEGYDRGAKFEQYRALPSLSDYVLISQGKPHVEHFVRQPDNRWLLSEANHLEDVIFLKSIDCKLLLADVYEKIGVSV